MPRPPLIPESFQGVSGSQPQGHSIANRSWSQRGHSVRGNMRWQRSENTETSGKSWSAIKATHRSVRLLCAASCFSHSPSLFWTLFGSQPKPRPHSSNVCQGVHLLHHISSCFMNVSPLPRCRRFASRCHRGRAARVHKQRPGMKTGTRSEARATFFFRSICRAVHGCICAGLAEFAFRS
jgi:hypothetical protein